MRLFFNAHERCVMEFMKAIITRGTMNCGLEGAGPDDVAMSANKYADAYLRQLDRNLKADDYRETFLKQQNIDWSGGKTRLKDFDKQ